MYVGKFIICLVNLLFGCEFEVYLFKILSKKVVVIGGGVGGFYVGWMVGFCGYDVIVYEVLDMIGG